MKKALLEALQKKYEANIAEADATAAQTITANANRYYRRVKVSNLM